MSLMPKTQAVAWLLLLALGAGCPDNIQEQGATPSADKPSDRPVVDQAYVPPKDVQLTPPAGHKMDEGPKISLDTSRKIHDLDVTGAGDRKLRCSLEGDQGQRSLSMALKDESVVELAAPDFHVLPTASSDAKGDVMICWNTLTGRATEYSPTAPDPSTGMGLFCRMLFEDSKLSEVTRIEAPTVGCWIQNVVALPGGGFRLLYMGDDGWFDLDHKNPLHGTYEAFYDGKSWSKPKLLLPPTDPSVEYEFPDPEVPADDAMPADEAMSGADEEATNQ